MKTGKNLAHGESYEDRIHRLYPEGQLRNRLLATYRRMSAIRTGADRAEADPAA